jgi:hydrogenase maturation protease
VSCVDCGKLAQLGSMGRVLILGVGNPVLGDDRVGLYIAERLERDLPPVAGDDEVAVDIATRGGLEFAEKLAGYDRAFVVDSIKTVGGQPGTIYELSVDDLQRTIHLLTVHGIGFRDAIEFGRQMGLHMPGDIRIYAIEVHDNLTLSEEMHPLVQQAGEEVERRIRALLASRR